MAEAHHGDEREPIAVQSPSSTSPLVLDYSPRHPLTLTKWLRRLPRPSWFTLVTLLLTAACANWLYTDRAAWVETRRFDGNLPLNPRNGVTTSDGARLLTIRPDEHTIRVYDIATGNAVIDLQRPAACAYTAEFSPDGSRIWSIGQDRHAILWDASSGQSLAWLPINIDDMGTTPAFSPDGRWAAATGDDRILRVCDTRNGAVVAEFPASAAAVFSPDGHYLAAGDASPEGVRLPDGHYLPGVDISPPCVRIWETQTWTSIAELRAASGDIDRDSEDGYWPGIGFSPDSKTLAIAFGSRIALWDAATGRMSTALTVVGGETNCGSFSHDGLYLFEPVDDGALGVWNMASHQRISTFPRYSEPSMISPDGTRIGDYGSILSYPSLTPLAGAPVDNKLKMGVFGWLPDGKAFVTENGTALALNYHGPPAIQLFRLRHPDTLYGLLWLPQCWLVIFGALASLWLIGRDLRRWRSSPMVVG